MNELHEFTNLQSYIKFSDVDSDDPTRIHTLRKYVGQAKGNDSVETVRAKQ